MHKGVATHHGYRVVVIVVIVAGGYKDLVLKKRKIHSKHRKNDENVISFV